MEARESRIRPEKELIMAMVKRKSGVQNISDDDDLEKTIGLTGDDAFELLTEYSKKFNVDISSFPFDQYFYDEGQFLVFFMSKFFRKYKKKKFTIENLMAGLDRGYLS